MKTMKRIAAGVLAAAILGSAATPVLAAAAPEKEETVYVVMNPDGSVKSQTVSEHLHSDGGLAGLADRSSLQNIVNTQGDAAFTREGDTLVWDTDETDVYYKGETDSRPPVTADIRYLLDGKLMTAEELAGKSGRLTVTVTLTNHETGTADINGTARPVCTPFVTVVGAVLNESFCNVTAEHGVVQGDGGTQIVGFVCLPGVRASVAGLLPEQASSMMDYLLDTVSFEADVTEFQAPSIMVACAADTEQLKDSSILGDLDGLDNLQGDLDKLTDAMEQLRGGAAQLNDGAIRLDDGAAQLRDGIGQADAGANQLKTGLSALNAGLSQLSGGLGQITANSDMLNSGVQQLADAVLASANQQLLDAGVITEAMTWGNYQTVLQQQLNISPAMLEQAREAIGQQAGGLQGASLDALIYLSALQMANGVDMAAAMQLVGAQMQRAQADSAPEGCIGMAQAALAAANGDPTAVPQVKALLEQLVYADIMRQLAPAAGDQAPLVLVYAAQNWDSGADTSTNFANAALALADPENNAVKIGLALQALAAANGDPMQVEAVKALVDAQCPAAYQALAGQTGVADASTNALLITMAAQASADPNDLSSGLAAAGDALMNASQVQSALAAVSDPGNENYPQAQQVITGLLTQAAAPQVESAARQACDQLTQVAALTAGLKQYTAAVAQAAAGAAAALSGGQQLEAGAGQLSSGTAQLVEGAKTLADGTAQLRGGAGELLDGVGRLDDEGISRLTGAIDAGQLQSLKEVLDLMEQRRKDYTSFAGAPEGAKVSVRFVMKTAETVSSAQTAASAQAAQPAAKTGFWQRLLALFGLGKNENG